ncbi:hypothetical protein RA280_43380 [Cupriavidus sp. CV2]|uniref:hypothetical protein n=1 Tax=Cupriavidus ulmosensis TaxID=3065913 RepID=UPI00296A9C93|nr:hypothetical protein [Cupriavidus sp. CV2]MDW3688453.1 hypothetical protein [Cupriavidus sp. CV2]
MHNLNRVFTCAICVAIALTGLSIFVKMPMPVAIVLELAPLGYYFYELWKRARQEGLSQTAIDSIYYFGFIITIFSLSASVFRVWLFGFGTDIGALVGHFAVGLLATGMALMFRMVLTAQTEALNAKDLGETVEDYIRRVDVLVAKVEASAANFEGLAASLQERTEKVVSDAHLAFSQGLSESAKIFQAEVSGVAEQASSAVGVFSSTIQKLSESTNVAQLERNISQLTVGLRNFAEEMTQYGRSVTQDAQTANRVALEASTKAHIEKLGVLYSKNTELIATGLAQVKQLDFTAESASVKGELQGLSRTITNFSKKFVELEQRLADTVVEQSTAAAKSTVEGFAGDFTRITAELEVAMFERASDMSRRLVAVTERHVAAVGAKTQEEVARQMSHVAEDVAGVHRALDSFRTSLDATRQVREGDELASAVQTVRGLLQDLGHSLAAAVAHCNELAERTPAAIAPFESRHDALHGLTGGAAPFTR